MTTLLYTHSAFGEHETPPGHVEGQGRYFAVEQELAAPAFGFLSRREAPLADPEKLALVHAPAYAAKIGALAEQRDKEGGILPLDPDTSLGRNTHEAALRAAGAAMAAVDAVAAGEATNAFIAARPPGHHATPDRAMGFCLYNSAAIAARHARMAHGLRRIAVVDFDVHHGNGTQDAFWDDEDAFFASSHEWPQYPGTGRAEDRGGAGTICNAPLPGGAGSFEFRRAWGDTLLPALSDFAPDMIVISAGFDAHAADPLGGLNLLEEDFAWVTAEILAVARQVCNGRTVSLLEGGYDLAALAKSVGTHVKTLATAS